MNERITDEIIISTLIRILAERSDMLMSYFVVLGMAFIECGLIEALTELGKEQVDDQQGMSISTKVIIAVYRELMVTNAICHIKGNSSPRRYITNFIYPLANCYVCSIAGNHFSTLSNMPPTIAFCTSHLHDCFDFQLTPFNFRSDIANIGLPCCVIYSTPSSPISHIKHGEQLTPVRPSEGDN